MSTYRRPSAGISRTSAIDWPDDLLAMVRKRAIEEDENVSALIRRGNGAVRWLHRADQKHSHRHSDELKPQPQAHLIFPRKSFSLPATRMRMWAVMQGDASAGCLRAHGLRLS